MTIGAYDGVHLGHRAVIDQVRSRAAAAGAASAVVTFDRHPASVVRPASAPPLLTDLDQKLELLAALGVDYTLVVHFDDARAKQEAEDFVAEDLVDCLNATAVVVGEDFHFGHRRRGNVAMLRAVGPGMGFEVAPVELVGTDGRPAAGAERVSSTGIRNALAAGDLARANRWLGRAHSVRGEVVHGDARGRELGFPTANVSVPEEICLPADGVYAGWYVRPTSERVAAAISIGRRPTFYEEEPFSLVEAHLLDWSGDLYGEYAAVEFAVHLRGQQRFDDVDELVAQMARDCDRARELLAGS